MRNLRQSLRIKLLVLAAGFVGAVVAGCYPEYEEEFLDSFNSATNTVTTTFIDAFFESLKPEEPVDLGIV